MAGEVPVVDRAEDGGILYPHRFALRLVAGAASGGIVGALLAWALSLGPLSLTGFGHAAAGGAGLPAFVGAGIGAAVGAFVAAFVALARTPARGGKRNP